MRTFKANPRASSELARMIGNSSVLDRVAADIAALWKANAPVDSRDYQKSIRVDPIDYHSRLGVIVKDRLVHSTDPAAHLIEYGYADSVRKITVKGHFTMTKTVRGIARVFKG
ncbi:HK97 gp10 family phage protein [Rothia sp. CCM 9417]|uniref:HK97 gp10 family phage protein n=1 Tax=Rothia sp. CCM 9417 TaxID=3402657 RepID=UPI003AE48139